MDALYCLVPHHRAGQFTSFEFLKIASASMVEKKDIKVLDLGCGDGRSFDLFSQVFTSFDWHGLDIDWSPEVELRTRSDCSFYSYNGVDIPFGDAHFDIVFSNHVFEHVRYPERLLAEVRRVLKVSGSFVGSVSYLEPYHSYSIFNYTPYGWYLLLKDAGLDLKLIGAGIDSLALIRRRIDKTSFDLGWWKESPFNSTIFQDNTLSTRKKNFRSLMFAGHMCFVASNSDSSSSLP